MVCPYCSHKTNVTNSRHQKRSNKVWRRRQCLHCLAVFTTLEEINYTNTLRVNQNGVYKPFLTDLLYTEVLLALSHRKNAYIDARELTDTIIKRLIASPQNPLFETHHISSATADTLQRFDKQAWHRYAAEHSSVT